MVEEEVMARARVVGLRRLDGGEGACEGERALGASSVAEEGKVKTDRRIYCIAQCCTKHAATVSVKEG